MEIAMSIGQSERKLIEKVDSRDMFLVASGGAPILERRAILARWETV